MEIESMRLSISVVVSAVMSFVMSARYLILAVRLLLMDVPVPHGQPVAEFRFLMFAVDAGFVGFAVWGIWNGIGVLRGRAWARFSLLLFASLLLVLETLGGFGTLHGIRNNPIPYVFARAMLPHFVMVLFVIWWLVILNTRRMRKRFASRSGSLS
jgi:hypothetical protein